MGEKLSDLEVSTMTEENDSVLFEITDWVFDNLESGTIRDVVALCRKYSITCGYKKVLLAPLFVIDLILYLGLAIPRAIFYLITKLLYNAKESFESKNPFTYFIVMDLFILFFLFFIVTAVISGIVYLIKLSTELIAKELRPGFYEVESDEQFSEEEVAKIREESKKKEKPKPNDYQDSFELNLKKGTVYVINDESFKEKM